MNYGWGWKPYVSVSERRKKAEKEMTKLQKTGTKVQPIKIEGRKIARTFWGESWCKQLESFSDYSNRLPRGRTYVRNGSVCHLHISDGKITAMVSGSELYKVNISIKTLPSAKWQSIIERCSGHIGSLLELLSGNFSNSVLKIVTDRKDGLFPSPSEIKLDCSCPDWATMCKHVAAVLYGVGARLDNEPELLFLLRGVNHNELITQGATLSLSTKGAGGQRRLADDDLADVFGINLLQTSNSTPREKKSPKAIAKAISSTSQKPTNTTKVSGKISGKTQAQDAAKTKTATKTLLPAATRAKSTSKTTKISAGSSTQADYAWPPTGKTVRVLRANLELSQSRFAELIGVSTSTINKWEKTRGRLKLLDSSLEALSQATKLTTKQAQRRLKA